MSQDPETTPRRQPARRTRTNGAESTVAPPRPRPRRPQVAEPASAVLHLVSEAPPVESLPIDSTYQSAVTQPPAPEASLAEWRELHWRQRPELRLQTREEAGALIRTLGICLFQPAVSLPFPSLYGAVAGTSGPAPRWGGHDRTYNRAWEIKDGLLGQGLYFGSVCAGRRAFMAAHFLEPLFALGLGGRYGGQPEDYRELYDEGLLTRPAKLIFEALLEAAAPLSTTKLRRATGLRDPEFGAGLETLQRALLVGAVGVASDNRWKYCFRYETIHRQFPAVVERATQLGSRAAAERLLSLLLVTAGSFRLAVVARALGLDLPRLERAAITLAERGEATLAGGVLGARC